MELGKQKRLDRGERGRAEVRR
jgi:hypothetical protein